MRGGIDNPTRYTCGRAGRNCAGDRLLSESGGSPRSYRGFIPRNVAARLHTGCCLSIFATFGQNSRARFHRAPCPTIVILKIDGLNADLLYRTMSEVDPTTGKSRLPWFSHIFAENGTIFQNFYTRGISLSAPSWSMLDSWPPYGNPRQRRVRPIYRPCLRLPEFLSVLHHECAQAPGRYAGCGSAGSGRHSPVARSFPLRPALPELSAFSTRSSLDDSGGRPESQAEIAIIIPLPCRRSRASFS